MINREPLYAASLPSGRQIGGEVTEPSEHDEVAFYAPPERSSLPPQTMLATALAVVLVILLGMGAGIYFLLGGPAGIDRGSHARAPSDSSEGEAAAVPAPVEEVVYLDVSRETARQMNAAVPFSDAPNPAAGPTLLDLSSMDFARAVDCLAAAEWYEAGDDPIGQQAVAQVIVNRMRHPSFPATVCGVVFQGSERSSGCQFTFTCDGSMRRRTPADAAWERARGNAAAILQGYVFSPVGWATHYHTDWVVPNWSSSVEKIARVDTHLFFRWRGAGGRPPAFRQAHAGAEPEVALMRKLSPAHAGTLSMDETNDAAALDQVEPQDGGSASSPAPRLVAPPADLRGNQLADSRPDKGLYVLKLQRDAYPGSFALMALDMCEESSRACTVIGYVGQPPEVTGGELGRVRWHGDMPDFYYFTDPARARELVYWNCSTFPRPQHTQCMPAGFRAEG